MRSLLAVAAVTLAIALCIGTQVNSAPTPLTDFDVNLFAGRFYQAYSDNVVMQTFERDGVCIFADYGLYEPNNGTVRVHNEMRKKTADGKVNIIEGIAYADGSNVPGHLMVQLSTMRPAPYWVLFTGPVVNGKYDYIIVSDNWSLTMWVLVRDLDRFFKEHDATALAWLKKNGFNKLWNKPIKTDHSGCTYPPFHWDSPKQDVEFFKNGDKHF